MLRTTLRTIAATVAATLIAVGLGAVTIGPLLTGPLVPVAPVAAEPAPAWSLDPADPVPAVQEDEPGWDCETMGNRQCGQPVPSELTGCVLLGECIPDPSPVPSCAFVDVEPALPCVVTDRVTGMDHVDAYGTVHAGCDLLLLNVEDAAILCPDGHRELS